MIGIISSYTLLYYCLIAWLLRQSLTLNIWFWDWPYWTVLHPRII